MSATENWLLVESHYQLSAIQHITIIGFTLG